MANAVRWVLVVGEKRTGKTTLATEIVRRLVDAGMRVAGVLQEAVEKDGVRVAYEAVRLDARASGDADRRVVVARKGATDRQPICSYAFDDDAFAKVAEWIAADAPNADVVLFDEVSVAEVNGRGHAAGIRKAMEMPAALVLCVRADVEAQVREKFGLPEPLVRVATGTTAAIDEVLGVLGRV